MAGCTYYSWQDGIVRRDIDLTLEHTKAEMVMLKDDERILIEIFLNDKNAITTLIFNSLKEIL